MRVIIKRCKIKRIKFDYNKLIQFEKIRDYYISKYLNEEAQLNTREKNINKLSKKFSLDHEEAKNIYDKWKEDFMKAKIIKW